MLESRKYIELLAKLPMFIGKDTEDSNRVYKISGKGQVSKFGKDNSKIEEDVIVI